MPARAPFDNVVAFTTVNDVAAASALERVVAA